MAPEMEERFQTLQEIVKAARQNLAPGPWDYLIGGTETETTLRRKAAHVRVVTPELRRVIGDMVETMYHQVGIGLAAPQVGFPYRLLVMDDGKGGARALINPVIMSRSGAHARRGQGPGRPGGPHRRCAAPLSRARTTLARCGRNRDGPGQLLGGC